MYEINCLSPSVIIHPSYVNSFVRSDAVVFIHDDVSETIHITPSHVGRILDGEHLLKVLNYSIDKTNYKDYVLSQFVNFHDGTCYDVFMYVPCGHCDACNSKRHNGIIQRLNFGFEEDERLTLFVTLTYNDSHLPSNGVCFRDIQLFKKRLNKLVYEKFDCRLKYGVFSEYGDEGRPHYHMVIYGMPILNDRSAFHRFEYFSRLLQFCWRKFPKRGFKRSERFDFDNYLNQNYSWFNISKSSPLVDKFSMGFVNVEFPQDGKCFGYISKYISKSSNVPKGKNKNFYRLSNHLGLGFVRSKLEYLNSSLDSKFVYRSRYGNGVRKTFLSSYYISKLFPSFSKLVTPEFRRKWLSLLYDSRWVSTNDSLPVWFRSKILDLRDKLHSRFPNLCPIFDVQVDSSLHSRYSELFQSYSIMPELHDDFLKNFLETFSYFDRLPSSFELDVSKKLLSRDKFLKKYSCLSVNPTLSAIGYSKTFNKYQYSKIL